MAPEKRLGEVNEERDAELPVAKRAKDEIGSESSQLSASRNDSKQIDEQAGEPDVNTIKRSPSPEVDIDLVISNLNIPECGAEVSQIYTSALTADRQVQAYAKLAGRNWTYFVQKLELIIGRYAGAPNDPVDIDLAPSKVVSRKHACISYNLRERQWEVITIGRNGLKLDGSLLKADQTATLKSGQILEIGGVQMMFILPDMEPCVAPIFIQKAKEAHQAHLEYQKQNAQYQASMEATSPQYMDASISGIQNPPNSQPLDSKQDANTSAYPRGVTMVTRSQVPTSQYYDYDLSSDDCKDIKPPFSYATMISQAILSTPEHMMTLADIYAWIAGHYAFYRRSKPGWQNSIRHNLSLNKAFQKVARRENEPGKGSKWHIAAAYKDELIRKATTGKQYRGAYLPRKPYDDSPPPPPNHAKIHREVPVAPTVDSASSGAAGSAGSAAAGPTGSTGSDSGEKKTDAEQQARSGMTLENLRAEYQHQRRMEEFERRQIKEIQKAEQVRQDDLRELRYLQQQQQKKHRRSSMNSNSSNASGSTNDHNNLDSKPAGGTTGGTTGGAPHENTQQPPQFPTMGPPFNNMHQRGFPIAVPLPDGTFQQMPGYQYMHPFGTVPFYPQSNSQSQSAQPMIPVMSFPPQFQYPGQSPTNGNSPEHSPKKQPTNLPPKQKPSEHQDRSEELKTPAKSVHYNEGDKDAEFPQIGSAIKLESTHTTAPESSPALWKYMNLESTPNNVSSNKTGGGNDNSGPESSPPRADLSSSLPILKNLENRV